MSSVTYINVLHPWFFPTIAIILGACIGSFLNVCIFRIPAGDSLIRPGSHCACGKPIQWYNNFPVFGWLRLGGKAPCCGNRISLRYPLIEGVTAVLFLACWYKFGHVSIIHTLAAATFLSILVCIFFIDLDHLIIPDRFTIGGGVVGVLFSVLAPTLHLTNSVCGPEHSLQAAWISIKGLCIGTGFILWIALLGEEVLKKEVMGFGDVKLLGMIGAFLGFEGALFSLFAGAFVGVFWNYIAMLVGKPISRNLPIDNTSPDAEKPQPQNQGEIPVMGSDAANGPGHCVPFGPMISIGAAVYMFAGRSILEVLLSFLGVAR